MNYQISHTTTYEYHETVATCQNIVHLAPRAVPRQTCHHHRLLVRPTPTSVSRRTDYFGNPVTYFSISEGHRKLSITSMSRVEVRPLHPFQPAESVPWETVRDGLPLDRGVHAVNNFQFCFDSPHVPRSGELADYARESFGAGRPILAAALELTARIHEGFSYDQHATTVHTPLAEVFASRRGVCQDLAHVQIGCLRSLGLAARYVSGYLQNAPSTRAAATGRRGRLACLGCGLLRRAGLDRRRSNEQCRSSIPSTSRLPGGGITRMFARSTGCLSAGGSRS